MTDDSPEHIVSLEEAVTLLQDGMLVAFPTETVYGLGADAGSTEALNRLYAAKGRPADHPVIVHLGEPSWLDDWAVATPQARALADRFWPGPLTMILPRRPGVSDLITGGQNTVGVRMPNHPVALELLRSFGRALVAPSANRFGRVSPTTAQHVMGEFPAEQVKVIDGGPCTVGVESTIVDLSGEYPVVLRPGGIASSQIFQALNLDDPKASSEVRAPGGLSSHYAPTRRSVLVDRRRWEDTIVEMASQGLRLAAISPHYHESLREWVEAPAESSGYARLLYAALRKLDSEDVDVILIEAPPEGEEWEAVHDRLRRATHQA